MTTIIKIYKTYYISFIVFLWLRTVYQLEIVFSQLLQHYWLLICCFWWILTPNCFSVSLLGTRQPSLFFGFFFNQTLQLLILVLSYLLEIETSVTAQVTSEFLLLLLCHVSSENAYISWSNFWVTEQQMP